MRILFTACPMVGHVNTLLPLALAAQRAGHTVAVRHRRRPGRPGRAGRPHRLVGRPDVRRGGLAPALADGLHRRGGQAPRRPAAARGALPPGRRRLRGDRGRGADRRAAVRRPDGPARAGDRRGRHRGRHRGRSGGLRTDPRRLRHAVAGGRPRRRRCRPRPTCRSARRRLAPPGRSTVRRLRPALSPPAPDDALPPAFAALPHARTVHLTLGTVFGTTGVLAAALAGLRELPVNVVVTTAGTTLPPQPANVLARPLPAARAAAAALRPRRVAGRGGHPVRRAWRTGCPSSCCRRRPTSPPTPVAVERAGAGPGAGAGRRHGGAGARRRGAAAGRAGLRRAGRGDPRGDRGHARRGRGGGSAVTGAPTRSRLGAVAVTPRPLPAYCDMFQLAVDDLLAGPILDCPAGASLVRRARAGDRRRGGRASTRPTRRPTASSTGWRPTSRGSAQWQRAHPAGFNWHYLGSPEELAETWAAALRSSPPTSHRTTPATSPPRCRACRSRTTGSR